MNGQGLSRAAVNVDDGVAQGGLLCAFGDHYRKCECAGFGMGIVARRVHRTAAQPCRDIRCVGHVAGGLLERRSSRRCSGRDTAISDLGGEEQQANPEQPAYGSLVHCATGDAGDFMLRLCTVIAHRKSPLAMSRDRKIPWLGYTTPVIPAKAGIQGAEIRAPAPCSCQGQALGPRFRGGHDLLVIPGSFPVRYSG